MAITRIKGSPGPTADGRIRILADVDGLTSYVAGGHVITAASLGYKAIVACLPSGSNDALNGVQARFTAKGPQASVRLVWLVVGTGAEVAGAVNLSTKFTRVEFTVI